MPIYEYKCPHCNKTKEIEQKVSEETLSLCPDCGKKGLTKQISSSVSLRFKGSGFYCTDYSTPSGHCDGCAHSK